MTSSYIRPQDLIAIALAGIVTLALPHLELPYSGADLSPRRSAEVERPSESALDDLVSAETAASEGELLLEQPSQQVELSFAPEHDRLVWRVHGIDRIVVLDAHTGEPLAFEFG